METSNPKTRPRTALGWMLIAAFLASLGLVIWLGVDAKQKLDAPLLSVLMATSQRPLPTGKPVLVLVFQSQDCQGRVQGFAEALRLRERFREIEVRGVLIDAPKDDDDAHNLLYGTALPIGLSYSQGHGVIDRKLLSLGLRSTPVLLGFDSTHTLRVIVDVRTALPAAEIILAQFHLAGQTPETPLPRAKE